MWIRSLVGKMPWRRENMETHSSILAWRIPWIRGAWWAIVHRVSKSQTQLKWLNRHRHRHWYILHIFLNDFLKVQLDTVLQKHSTQYQGINYSWSPFLFVKSTYTIWLWCIQLQAAVFFIFLFFLFFLLLFSFFWLKFSYIFPLCHVFCNYSLNIWFLSTLWTRKSVLA